MWFTENPWPPIALFAGLAIWFGERAVSRRSPLHGAAALSCVLAAFAVLGIEGAIVTDRERIVAGLQECLAAFRRKDREGTLKWFAPEAEIERRAVAQGMQLVVVGEDLRVFDETVEFRPDGTAARCTFRANGTITVTGGTFTSHVATSWDFTWESTPEGWRIRRVVRLDPQSGKAIELYDP